ncbi:MAG: hypothetical protein K1X83_08470 [Oligoflexia bacterium]|nr:hypothetical protein [Oligoflexia bacterium]
MRVALCLSGLPRSFVKCAESVRKHLIEPYQPDIFISTWQSTLIDDKFPETHSPDELINHYNPIKFDIEIFDQRRQKSFETNPFKNHADQAGRSVGRMLPMFYRIFIADLHRFSYEQENRFKYDVVVRCRSDLRFDGPVKLEKTDPGVVCFPIKNSTSHVNDQFWFCDSGTSSQLCALYNFIPQLWHNGVLIHGEALLFAYVSAKGLTVKPVEINYEIVR